VRKRSVKAADIYFGPTDAPKGREKNWIQSDPAKGFFVVFRFYGPLEGYIDKNLGAQRLRVDRLDGDDAKG
jgi:hypothetical protein